MDSDRAIRFGGEHTPEGFVFELSGGALPLDFVNTVDERPRGGLERFCAYRDLINWSEQSGLLDARQSALLTVIATEHPDAAVRVYDEALVLRELIFDTVKAVIQARPLPGPQVRRWNSWRRRIGERRSIVSSSNGLDWHLTEVTAQLDNILLAVAEAALLLFTDPRERRRLRLCAADNCDWAFLDRSHRQNRIWCDMTVCGNRAKASRHYHRSSQP